MNGWRRKGNISPLGKVSTLDDNRNFSTRRCLAGLDLSDLGRRLGRDLELSLSRGSRVTLRESCSQETQKRGEHKADAGASCRESSGGQHQVLLGSEGNIQSSDGILGARIFNVKACRRVVAGQCRDGPLGRLQTTRRSTGASLRGHGMLPESLGALSPAGGKSLREVAPARRGASSPIMSAASICLALVLTPATT